MLFVYPGETDPGPDARAGAGDERVQRGARQGGCAPRARRAAPAVGGDAADLLGAATGRPSRTARSPRPRSSSAATGSSRRGRRRRPSSGPRARRSATARSRCGRSPRASDYAPEIEEASRAVAAAAGADHRRVAGRDGAAPAATRADRRDLADRVGARDRDRRAHRARRRPGRGPRPGRLRRRARALAGDRRPDNPGAWLTATAKHRAIDLMRRGSTPPGQVRADRARPRRRRARSRTSTPSWTTTSATTCCASIFTVLPSGPVDGGARGADAAAARRADDAGDRAGVPRARGDGRPAHLAREADARRGGRAVRGAGRATSCRRAWPRCSRSST